MSRFAKLFAANAIAAAGLGAAAVALSPAAIADPILPPVVPGVPALSMIQDLANPAGVGAVLQTAATALTGASSMVGAPAPNTLPVSPIVGAPATPPVPAAPTPATGLIGSTVVPLLTQIGVPAQLVNLAPQMPALGNSAAVAAPLAPVTAAAPLAPLAPVAPIAPAIAPAAPIAPIAPIAPVAPVAPSSAAVDPLAMLTALP